MGCRLGRWGLPVIVPLGKREWEQLICTLPLTLTDDTRGVASIDPETGDLWGAVVCENWTVTSVACHIAVTNRHAFRDGLHKELANYVFNQAGRIKIIGTVPADNDAALKLNRHLGFKELFRIEEGYDWGIDYVIMELKKEDCPYWTPQENTDGQIRSRAA